MLVLRLHKGFYCDPVLCVQINVCYCREYSKEMLPHADQLLKYLHDYQQKLGIKIQFNTEISNIRNIYNDSAPDGILHMFDDQNGNTYTCKSVHCVLGSVCLFVCECVCGGECGCVCVWMDE